MRILCCLAIVAFIMAAPAVWVADTSPAVASADPAGAFRTPEGAAPPVAGSESGPVSLPAGNAGSPAPGPIAGARLFGETQMATNDAAPMQVAQAGGASGPTPAAAPESNPWIFGGTIYLWVPFATSTSTIASLPPVDSGWPRTDSHLTNLYAGAGQFQLSKGDWGLWGDVSGASLGFKDVLLREDPLHPTRAERSADTSYSVVSGQYGLSYRLLGRPLDLNTWARGTQPVALDLLAGAQTFYFSASVNTQREQASASTTLTSPLVGARLGWDLADRWNLGLGGTIGGFGVSDTHLTWQADLTVAYRFRMGDVPGAVSLGFRAQGLNFETGSDANYLKVDEILYGPMLGFSVFF